MSLNRLGDLDATQGNSTSALAGAERSLELMKAVAAMDPEQQVWQQDLAIAWRRVAELNSQAGQWKRATAAFNEALQIAEGQPERPRWFSEAEISLHGLANANEALDDFAGASAHVEAALKQAEKLASFEPGNPELQLGVGKCHRRLASLARRVSDVAGASEASQRARNSLQRATELARTHYRRRPEHRDFRRGLVTALTKLAQLENELDSPGEAERLLNEALQLASEMGAADPVDTVVQRDVLAVRAALGQAQSRLGQAERGWATHEARLESVRRWLERDPEGTIWRREELSALQDMAHTPVAPARRREAAIKWLDRARLLAGRDLTQLEPREHVFRCLRSLAQLALEESFGTCVFRLT